MEQHHFDIVNHATPRLESMDKALGRGKYTISAAARSLS